MQPPSLGRDTAGSRGPCRGERLWTHGHPGGEGEGDGETDGEVAWKRGNSLYNSGSSNLGSSQQEGVGGGRKVKEGRDTRIPVADSYGCMAGEPITILYEAISLRLKIN